MDKQEVILKLKSIDREGMAEFIDKIEKVGYFEGPGSTRFHGAFEGGLFYHCNKLYELFTDMLKKFDIDFPDESALICAFLHDLCKVGAYIKNGEKYSWNKKMPSGHSILSVKRIEKHIKLTDQERMIIQYHMGMYGTNEFASNKPYLEGEYSLQELVNAYQKEKLCKLFYFCDDMSTNFVEE
jgi:23S rRNA maturation-related 3'-5' exoribonuclease YhaM